MVLGMATLMVKLKEWRWEVLRVLQSVQPRVLRKEPLLVKPTVMLSVRLSGFLSAHGSALTWVLLSEQQSELRLETQLVHLLVQR